MTGPDAAVLGLGMLLRVSLPVLGLQPAAARTPGVS